MAEKIATGIQTFKAVTWIEQASFWQLPAREPAPSERAERDAFMLGGNGSLSALRKPELHECVRQPTVSVDGQPVTCHVGTNRYSTFVILLSLNLRANTSTEFRLIKTG